jgi:CRP-like cAMP-binding protein
MEDTNSDHSFSRRLQVMGGRESSVPAVKIDSSTRSTRSQTPIAMDSSNRSTRSQGQRPTLQRLPENSTASFRIGAGMVAGINTASDRKRVEEERMESRGVVLLPWNKKYKAWWGLTVFGAIVTMFFETYQIAFSPPGPYSVSDNSSIIEYLLISIFVVDIIVNFHLAYFDEQDAIIYDRKSIARHYLAFMFWVDFVGVFPFYVVALACSGQLGNGDSKLAEYLALLRLLRMVRLYRVWQLFVSLQYNTHISLMWLTIIRNFSAALVWSHFSACVIYFIAKQFDFDPDQTWIGGQVNDLNLFERYVTSLYWSLVTFCTVGYGDYSPVNWAEQIWGMIFMLINIIIYSWMIGSITLLIVKHDEKTGEYRDSLKVLAEYSALHSFDRALQKRLKTQLTLDNNNREIADEQVLQNFPSAVRCKVLRKLYMPSLVRTNLMKGVRQQFVDAFLITCKVEIFSPGEEILQRGSIASDLYLLVGGAVRLISTTSTGDSAGNYIRTSVVGDSEYGDHDGGGRRDLEEGEFINEIGFFTDSPQIDTVVTKSVCKTLTMSRSAYKMIAEDHPGSVGTILRNLLAKVEQMAEECSDENVNLPTRLEVLRAGSVFDGSKGKSIRGDSNQTLTSVQTEIALTAVKDLIKMHMNKQKDDHTTRFLFAASRGETSTTVLMCNQGFDPNSTDYDCRTALMVASMKGNTETVSKILEYEANPNLVDTHGSSALYEAATNGHEDTMHVLLTHGANLCMDEGKAASTLCQAVFDGDIVTLRRLLKAGIQVNASDYDKRTAAHIAASEGNVAAIKVLVEFGADLTLTDRWKNTVEDDAKRDRASHILEYLRTLQAPSSPIATE